MLDEMRQIAEGLPHTPASVVVFGSFARGQAEPESDIDTLLVRPQGIEETDEVWEVTVRQWIDQLAAVSGNRVDVLEVAAAEVKARLSSTQTVWQEIRREGILIIGSPLESI
jgi:predicted nucleotidyltransferase